MGQNKYRNGGGLINTLKEGKKRGKKQKKTKKNNSVGQRVCVLVGVWGQVEKDGEEKFVCCL